jgi:hypothetical protein
MTNAAESEPPIKLTALLSEEALQLLTASGVGLVKRIGVDVIRGVVLDVLMGRNLRSATEILTRRRVAALNLATVRMFVQGSQVIDGFIERLPFLATDVLRTTHVPTEERWLAQWILGLTDKGVQNVLRDDREQLNGYRDRYIEACREIIAQQLQGAGELSGELRLGVDMQVNLNWLFITYLLNTVGAQTLTLRGSDKSTYGKVFEKLVLGSLLHILGFQFQPTGALENPNRTFWLSSVDDKRESDATLLYEVGQGVRFDIGFIGRGNTEISLDKVTRYQREIQLGRQHWYMATLILVDRIGERSKVEALAKEIGGTIIQMSAGFWPQRVAKTLNRVLGYQSPLLQMDQSEVGDYLRAQMQQVPLETFIASA